jgi:hypothetical protein
MCIRVSGCSLLCAVVVVVVSPLKGAGVYFETNGGRGMGSVG